MTTLLHQTKMKKVLTNNCDRIKKLNRRIGLLIVISLSLIYWSIIKYQDYQFTFEENEILTYELMQIEHERDSLINVLNKQNQKHEQVEPIIKKVEKIKSTQLIDTLKKDVTLPIDNPLEPKDTLNH